MKAKSLSRKAIEHLLIDLNYTSDYKVDGLLDAPYLIFNDKNIKPVYSNSEYSKCNYEEFNEHKILSLLPISEKTTMSKQDKKIIKLVNMLNSNKNKGLSGYDVAFNYMLSDGSSFGKTKIYPVTNCACGGISSETMKFIIEYCDKNYLDAYFTHCDIHDEVKRYGTHTPCITFY